MLIDIYVIQFYYFYMAFLDVLSSIGSAVGSILNPIGTIGNLVLGGINTSNQLSVDRHNLALQEKNFALQQDVYNYEKALQERIFQREDNAIQRRALDLEAAGLSKTLAAGSGANAGQVIQQTAPQHDTYQPGLTQVLSSITDMINQTKQVSSTMALNDAQSKLMKSETRLNNINASLQEDYGSQQRIAEILRANLESQYISDIQINKGKEEIKSLLYSHSLNSANIEKVFSEIGINQATFKLIESQINESIANVSHTQQLTANEVEKLNALYLENVLTQLQTIRTEQDIGITSYNRDYYESFGLPYQSSGSPVMTDFSLNSPFFGGFSTRTPVSFPGFGNSTPVSFDGSSFDAFTGNRYDFHKAHYYEMIRNSKSYRSKSYSQMSDVEKEAFWDLINRS